MRVLTARELLSKKLVFGDPKQIEALTVLRVLNHLNELKQKYPNIDYTCDECDGSGYFYDNDTDDCDVCDGKGHVELFNLEYVDQYQIEDQIQFIMEHCK